MSPFLIFFIVVNLAYVLYYAAIITMDMHARPKDAVTTGETMEAPDGMQATEDTHDSEEETTSREPDSEGENPERYSEDESDDNHQDEDNSQDSYLNGNVRPEEAPYEPESEKPEDYPSPEDDDVYGIDRQMAEEQQASQEQASSSDLTAMKPGETSDEDTFENSGNTDEDIDSEESFRAMILRQMQERAKAEGAEFVEAEVHDNNEFDDDDDDDPVVMVDSQNCDTGRAAEINANSEPIITESMTPVRQDRFAPNVLGALYRMKERNQGHEEEEKPVIDPDNIEKKENITNA